jgi:hypothetical protein
MTSTPRLTAILVAAVNLTSATAQAQSVSGAFTLDDKPFNPTHAAAFRIRNQNPPGRLRRT